MTDKFIPPPPSDAAMHAASAARNAGGFEREAISAAFAHDQPRVCRAEVEKFLAEFVTRYGPASGGTWRLNAPTTLGNQAPTPPAPSSMPRGRPSEHPEARADVADEDVGGG